MIPDASQNFNRKYVNNFPTFAEKMPWVFSKSGDPD